MTGSDALRSRAEHAANLIDSLLCPDVGRRLGSARGAARGEVRSHPFFWGLEWERLERRSVEPPHAHYTRERALEAKKVFADTVSPVRTVGFM